MSDARKALNAAGAPEAVGPYSHAVAANGFLFVSGQLGLLPDGSGLAAGGVVDEARQALANLATIASAGGASLDDAVKVTVYLADIADFKAVNEVYAEFFPGEDPPARAAVEVAALPLGGQVEVDAVFAIADSA